LTRAQLTRSALEALRNALYKSTNTTTTTTTTTTITTTTIN